MKTECLSNTNFQGQVIKTGRNFSAKPKQCLDDLEVSLNNLIKSKDFDLYIHQDYSKNEIVFMTDNIAISEGIPINSKKSKYIETAKNVIEEQENAIFAYKQEEWNSDQNKAKFKDLCAVLLYFAVLPFLFISEDIKEVLKDLKVNFNKLAIKFAKKKG